MKNMWCNWDILTSQLLKNFKISFISRYTNEEGSVKLDYNDLLAVKALIYLKNSNSAAHKIKIETDIKAES